MTKEDLGEELARVRARLVDMEQAHAEVIAELADREQSEQARRGFERHARAALDGLDAHVAIIDENGTIEAVNQAWRRFAASNGPVVGTVCEGANYLEACRCGDGSDGQTADQFAQGIRDVLAGRRDAFQLEYDCHSPDQERWFVGRVARFPGGGTPRVVVIHEDITARRLAEEALREAKLRLEEAIKAGKVGLWDWDLTADKVYYSSEWKRQIGYGDHEIGNSYEEWQSRIHPDDLDSTLEQVRRSIAEVGQDFQAEFRFRHKNGSWRWILARASVDQDLAGRPIRMRGSHVDVTDRRCSEVALHASNERNRLLLEHAGLGIGYFDLEGICLLMNRKICEIMKAMPSDLVGRHVSEVFPGEMGGLILERIGRAAGQEQSATFEEELDVPAGRRWFMSTYARIVDGAGQVVGVQIISEDIFQRKRIEQEREAIIEILRLLHAPNNLRNLMKDVSLCMREWSGCDAVGIRLREGDDYPYFETRGFPGDFVEAENRLCELDEEGIPVRDAAGNPVLECMCGNILCGRFDPSNPFFTANGTFWSNSTTELLASTSEADRQARTRNRCNGEGYESVALIPLRAGGETFGLLQFNDKRKDRFTTDLITMLERIAANLAVGLSQRKAAMALRESEETYRTLFENMAQGAFYQRADGTLVDCNPAVMEMFGQTREQILGRTSMDPRWKVVTEDGVPLPGDEHPSMKAFSTGRPLRDVIVGVFNPRREDYVWLNVSAIPQFRPGEDKPYQVFVTLHDITDRKHIEQAYEMLFREMIDGFALHQIILNDAGCPVDYRFLAVNPAFERMTGLQAVDILGRTVLEVLPGTERHWIDTYGRVARTGEPAFFEQYSRDLGRHFEVTAYQPAQGQLATIFVDVTDRNMAEQERQRLMSAIEQAAEVVVITDADGGIQYANPAFEQVTGYAPAEVLGQNPRILRSGEHNEAFYADLWNTISRGDTWSGRFTNKKKDGTIYTEEAVISPVRDASGTIVSYVAVKRDITEILRSQEQLRQVQKLNAIGQMSAGVAHDFNNYLTAIRGNTEVAAALVEGNQRVRELLGFVQQAVEQATEVVQSLLTFGRGVSAPKRGVHLCDVVTEAGRLIRHAMPRNIALKINLRCNQPCWINADPTQLHQILLNLAINARDAMPEGGAMHVEVKPEPPGFVSLIVSDTGTGMPPEVAERVFEPFFTTKERGEGTGLGLSIIHGIVTDHGGTISLESREGEGTTFTIQLPLADNRTGTPVQGAAADFAGTDPRGLVLLAHADRYFCSMVVTHLESLNYSVQQVHGADMLLDAVRRCMGDIGLLVVAARLGQDDGIDCIRQIRQQGLECPVILLTESSEADPVAPDDRTTLLNEPLGVGDLALMIHQELSERTSQG